MFVKVRYGMFADKYRCWCVHAKHLAACVLGGEHRCPTDTSKQHDKHFQTETLRKNNVIITSKRHHNAIITSFLILKSFFVEHEDALR